MNDNSDFTRHIGAALELMKGYGPEELEQATMIVCGNGSVIVQTDRDCTVFRGDED